MYDVGLFWIQVAQDMDRSNVGVLVGCILLRIGTGDVGCRLDSAGSG
jgi:hypothetical protein